MLDLFRQYPSPSLLLVLPAAIFGVAVAFIVVPVVLREVVPVVVSSVIEALF